MVTYSAFQEDQFRRRVDKALKTVATILDTTRTPRYAEEQDHQYDDKYELANFMTNTAIASYINVLERMGLGAEKLQKLCDAVHQEKRSVTLRFAAEDSCVFLLEKDVNVLSHDTEHVVKSTTETSGVLGGTKTQTVSSKVERKVREYHWDVGVTYKLFCFVGNDPEKDPILLEERSSSTTIITTGTKTSPVPVKTVHPFVDVNLTWLLQQIKTEKQVCQFEIDRSKDTCRTPRRNEDIDAAFAFFADFKKWSAMCYQHFRNRIEASILGKHEEEHVRSRVEKSILGRQTATSESPAAKPPSLASLNAEGVFCPILPLFEEPREVAGTASREEDSKSLVLLTRSGDSATSPLLSVGDIDKFLNEQIRQLDDGKVSMGKMFPASDEADKIITATEASLALLWHHTQFLTITYGTGMDYIEEMLRKQLIAAIGKEVHKEDFDEFIRFHGKKLFGPDYAPSPFCYAIRRPDHYPDGVLSIEANNTTDKMEPIETTVKYIENGPSMFLPINAATSVEFTGHRYLHGWIQHKFESAMPGAHVMPTNDFSLTARARQFSSFLVMTGTISGPAEFTPKDAIVLQNKDEVIIPLLLNELPTAKEFKDAISSLSPEQQRFAKAFRGMQLESSVFGVCVVQLKPQLEILLGLPPDALLKEIRLTQDLLSLFVDYQIPSDLLSFDGAADAPTADKVAAVKEHVKAVMDVIDDAKKKQLDETEKRAEMNLFRAAAETEECGSSFASSPSPAAFGAFGGPARMMARAAAHSAPMMAAPPKKSKGGALASFSTFGSCSTPRRLERQAQRAPMDDMESLSGGGGGLGESAPHEDTFASLAPTDQLTSPVSPGMVDFTAIPKRLDAKFDVHDGESALRATIIKTDKTWTRMRQENLLTKAQKTVLGSDDIKSEKDKAFDLLDALSRSGSLPIACAELHVVVAVTHCFEKDVMNTVIQDNVNPIEKVEKTMVLMGSTIHNVPPAALLADQAHSARLMQSFPTLFALAENEQS